MQQLDLAAPIARATDPATSHIAAERKTHSGSRRRDADLLLAVIRENPGHTSSELAQLLIATGINWHRASQIASKRISDLAPFEIYDTGKRRCEITGHQARCWVAK